MTQTRTTHSPAIESGAAPPPFVERILGALVADALLREAVLGDLAEEFAARCARDRPDQARHWYRTQVARSAPALLAMTWWPEPGRRPGRIGALLAAGGGPLLLLQLLHQAAQLLVAPALASAGLTVLGWPFIACSLVIGAACAVLAGAAATRAVREAPLAGALALAVGCGALAVAGMLVNGGVNPLWYWGGLQLVVMPVSACTGGMVRTLLAPYGASPAGAP